MNIVNPVLNLIEQTSTNLSGDVVKAIKEAKKREKKLASDTLNIILKNIYKPAHRYQVL